MSNNNASVTTPGIVRMIQQRCQDLGMSPRELRRATGMGYFRFRRMWSGKEMWLNDYCRIAVALDCKLTDLLPVEKLHK